MVHLLHRLYGVDAPGCYCLFRRGQTIVVLWIVILTITFTFTLTLNRTTFVLLTLYIILATSLTLQSNVRQVSCIFAQPFSAWQSISTWNEVVSLEFVLVNIWLSGVQYKQDVDVAKLWAQA